jgi:hypothetical protein
MPGFLHPLSEFVQSESSSPLSNSTCLTARIGCIVFPGGFLPTVNLLVDTLTKGSAGSLIVDSISNIGPHYARTLREWRRRFEAKFDEVIVPALRREYPEVMGPQTGQKGLREIEVFKRKWICESINFSPPFCSQSYLFSSLDAFNL